MYYMKLMEVFTKGTRITFLFTFAESGKGREGQTYKAYKEVQRVGSLTTTSKVFSPNNET